ncbi:hypothetical protein PAXRUDRAFT_16897 [Paxillus rubicundulus Ve08.2h10]|uniref:Uncharacterized protein n=1 Tax=Paxillus rubicundulus Ve08.2h10 TaxID=930991 RepID=A0A0D0DJT4_9AGAM|nr:hypothetical protein PAXRUDRAFT_16897 [Paxillus rubicundulus Ve08.2h10]
MSLDTEDEESLSLSDEEGDHSSDEFYYNPGSEDQIEADEALTTPAPAPPCTPSPNPLPVVPAPANASVGSPTSNCSNVSTMTPAQAMSPEQPLFTGPLSLMPLFVQYSKLMEEQGWAYLQQVHSQGSTLVDTVAVQAAQLNITNTHSVMVKHEISTLHEQQAGKKKAKGQMMEFKAHYISHPDMKAAFKAQQQAQEEKQVKDAEKQVQKKVDSQARMARIDHNVILKTFNNLQSCYKCKDDLITIA